MDERAAAINGRLKRMVAGIKLPRIALPYAELAEKSWQAILVSSEWTWADQTRALKARKTYGEGDA